MVDDEWFIKYIRKNFTFLDSFWDIRSLEGFIYPETYYFKSGDFKSVLFPELLIKTSLKEFGKKAFTLFKNCDISKWCNPYRLTNYEILIIASIVEKEEFNKKNMPYIADILIRRYKNGWFLGADWTLCYGLKIISKECSKYLYNDYLKDKNNLYNTRARKWLPPTPVWNPSIYSIKSVLYPKKNNYWYYLHGCNWKIYFARNASEHNFNKRFLCK